MYSIEAFGGQGYGSFGGRGAHIYGEFLLTAGTTIKILVGQKAGHYFDWPNTGYNNQYGGGGGSFVTDNANTPYVVAGGGGGNHVLSFSTTCDAQLTTAGAAGTVATTLGAGGTGGMGGSDAASADGGGGLLGNGAGVAGGQAYINGGLGGIDEGTGGFGCGGGTSSWNNVRAGGGGGYSGGGAANNGASGFATGGGGGSYNNGSSPVDLAGIQLGDGMIVITNLCAPAVGTLVADVASLSPISEDCAYTPPTPLASNSCSGGLEGTPDVTFPITALGTVTVTWTYDDGTNIITQTQSVTLTADVTNPIADVASLADITDACEITPPAPTATDACSGALVGVPDVVFPISALGTTVVTWSYDDGSGNVVTQVQNIIVTADVTPPVLDNPTLNSMGGQCNFTPPYPTATDVCAGSITGVPDVILPLTMQGLTTITWTFDDGSGNTVTQMQNITLNDIGAPAFDIPSLPDFTGCDDATPPTATATDNCAGALNGTPDVSFPITASGPTTVTWSYDDGNGNISTQTQDVYVITIDPSVTVVDATITAANTTGTYQWVDCDTGLDIAGATSQSYTSAVTGNFSVTITEGGCSVTSICSLIDYSGLAQLVVNPFTVSPNPNNGQFNITFTNDLTYELTIMDITGKIVFADSEVSNNNTITAKGLATGTYYVIVKNDGYSTTEKMIIK